MKSLDRARNIMLIAGESSGDRIAGPLIRALRAIAARSNIELEITGIGGSECVREGMTCFYRAEEMSVVGFVEVAKRFPFFRMVFRYMTKLLAQQKPDTLVLIDYPGFNIRLAKEAKKLGLSVVYYVSPQVWAWHKSRIKVLRNVVDRMLVIFPFEELVYKQAGLKNAYYVGHPLIERMDIERRSFETREEFAARHHLDPSKKWLVIFPGSRTGELERMLKPMMEAASVFSLANDMLPIVAESLAIPKSLYDTLLGPWPNIVRFRADQTHELMSHSDLGLLKSGTTTLEAALLGLPGVIAYKAHPLTFAIGKRLVKLPYIGLANIVAEKKIYPELLQNEVTKDLLFHALEEVWERRDAMRNDLAGLDQKLRQIGAVPSEYAAELIWNVQAQ